MSDAASAYPDGWESDVVLVDGSTVHVRPIRPTDRRLIEAFHGRQSAESIYLRYFTPRATLSARDLDHFTRVDYRDRMAFVALRGESLVGVARYDRWSGRDDAEVAFMVDDDHQGLGIGTVLLEFLAEAARQVGFTRFSAQVLPSNRKMLSVFKQVGFETTSEFGDGVIEVMLGIESTVEAADAIEEREHLAEARSVARLLSPRSVAVVGAGRAKGGLGHEVVVNLLASGFRGPVYPVNPSAQSVAGLPAYASMLDLPGPVDQAVIAVPAPAVAEVVLACARARVQCVVILSSGFGETGPEGAEAERDLVALSRRYGMRVVGPNCLGLLNTDPEVRLHASSTSATPDDGRLGVLCQSGALGTAILDHAEALGLGVSTFVEAGNKADVSANDLLQFWEDDVRTEVVLLHLESFGNPRRFSRIARRVARVKPVVAVKSGLGLPGVVDRDDLRGASADALLAQMGVIRVDAIEAMFDVARVLLHQPLPRGRRVAVVANARGPARLAADACLGAGLELAPLSSGTVTALASAMSPTGRAENPVDLTHLAGPAEFASALALVAADDGVDSIVAIYAPPVADRTAEVVAAVTDASEHLDKAMVATVLGEGARDLSGVDGGVVPSFTFPERAARALGAVSGYGAWRAQPAGEQVAIEGLDPDAASALVADALAGTEDGRWLGAAEVEALAVAYGLAVVPNRLVGSAREAVRAASVIGYPVTLKATGMRRPGKTEATGVALDLHRADEVRRAYARMTKALGDAMHPACVQAMVAPGVDLSVNLHQHPSVGSVVTVAMGGAAAATTREAAVRLLPVTDLDIARLLESDPVRSWLDGPHGPMGRAGLADLLARLGRLAEDLPEVAELGADPVIVSADGMEIVGLEVRVAPWRRDESRGLRRL